MADQTKIQWCDSTFNMWEGCTKVGPGCDHCYAENRNARFGGGESPNWGPGAPRRLTSEANRAKPHTWNKHPFLECNDCGHRGADFAGVGSICPCCNGEHPICPDCGACDTKEARRRVFSASLSDWLDNEVPIEWLVGLLDTIRLTPNLDWLLLSKRIGNWRSRLSAAAALCSRSSERAALHRWVLEWLISDKAPANVWLGATIVNHTEAMRDIQKLLHVPARIHFLSCEPLLGVLDLDGACDEAGDTGTNKIDWVIAGGESGPNARPMHPDWLRRLRDQCETFDIRFLFKQWGEWAPYDRSATDSQKFAVPGSTDTPLQKFGKKIAGNMLDGRQHLEFPA